MNKMNLFLGAFVLNAVFLFSCSSNECNCTDNPSSNSVNTPSSSSAHIVEDQKLVRKNITVSSVASYADIDGEPIAYTEVNAANNLIKIDLVAYCNPDMDNMGCKNNSVYKPSEIGLFWNTNYVGSRTYLFEIPPSQSDIFKTAAKLSDIIPTMNSLIDAGNISGYGVKEISIEKGKVFCVVSSEDKHRIVIIKETGDRSIDLEIIQLHY